MKINFFFGVDISKLTLDIALLVPNGTLTSYKIENSEKEITNFLSDMKKEHVVKFREVFFCAEHSLGILTLVLMHFTRSSTCKRS